MPKQSPSRAPRRPNFQNLKKRAKQLLRAYEARDPEALRRIETFFPKLAGASEDEIAQADFALQDAQLVIARETGYTTWAMLNANFSLGDFT